MPDFDIDFCQDNRDRVIDYVKAEVRRATRSARSRPSARMAAQGRACATSAACSAWATAIRRRHRQADPAPAGQARSRCSAPRASREASVIYARREAPEIEQRETNEEEVAELLALAEQLEGLTRNVGMHAGGVLIAPGKLTDFCPLYMQPGSDERGAASSTRTTSRRSAWSSSTSSAWRR